MSEETLEEAIKAHLKQADLSQAAVARKLHYTPAQFNKWIKGVNRMPDIVIQEFADLLDLSDEERKKLFDLAGYVAINQTEEPEPDSSTSISFVESLSQTLGQSMFPIDIPFSKNVDFLGLKEQGLRINVVALANAPKTISKKEIKSLFDEFYLAIQLDEIADQISGNPHLRNGIWGLLCVVFEHGCSEELVNFARRQRMVDLSLFKITGVTSVCWVIEVKRNKVTTHWPFPTPLSTVSDVFYPGKNYFQASLQAWHNHNENV